MDSDHLREELEEALSDLRRMTDIWRSWRTRSYTDDEAAECEALREKLLRKQGLLEPATTVLTGKRYISQFGRTMEVWSMALRKGGPSGLALGNAVDTTFLDTLADILLEAIGRVEAGATFEPQHAREILKIFISHGGPTAARTKIEKFIRAIGADPIIVEDQPNLGVSVNDKVLREATGSHYAVILGTADRGARQDDQVFPRLNVIDEFARLQSLLGRERVLLLLENGVNVPSNIAEFVRARFTQDCTDEALIQFSSELRALGLLSVLATER